MKSNFYNTTNQSGIELKSSMQNAKNQAQRIFKIMKHCNEPMTPFDVLMVYNSFFKPVPITSIRRAITDLTDGNKLIKTAQQKAGHYGVTNYCWIVPGK
jgi:hypothetical protein|tara:strand:+ start:254 stop:550 length:297 start_codon:yes stop_codon:yes gene_type:complete